MSKEIIRSRIAGLRQLMREQGVDAYLVTSGDDHGSEYVGDYFKGRAYLSGFTGSAGTLVVTADKAALWTDGRYFLQAADQLSDTGIDLMKMGEPGVPTVSGYLKDTLAEGQSLAYDGRTVELSYAEMLKKALPGRAIRETLDLVSPLWTDRPPLPGTKAWLLDGSYTGSSRAERLADVRAALERERADALLLSSLDDIAWLFHLRGDDIAFNPVVMAYALVKKDETVLYACPDAFDEAVTAALYADGVTLRPYEQVYADAAVLQGKVWIDEASTNVALFAALEGSGAELLRKDNPTTLPKAVKTETEQKNLRLCHVKDGVAVTRLICWLKHLKAEDYPTLTELAVAEKLESFRRAQTDYIEQSFEPIIAIGPHGAIIHYEPTPETDAPLAANTFLLMDTGGQYLQGTTDITRTTSLGEVTEEMKRHYTAVLRGHIRLAMARFKKGCTGANLDYLARSPLWELGLDYNHGTGHGVGYLLNVHEGPQNIGLRGRDGSVGAALQPGMITSDEPGLYLEGRYGVRLESLILCCERETTAYGSFYGFDSITMVPFDRASILPEMMTQEELDWLNGYHKTVYETLSPHMGVAEWLWLRKETAPLHK